MGTFAMSAGILLLSLPMALSQEQYFGFNQDTITFTEEEIACIFRKTPKEQIPQPLAKKLVYLNLYDDYTHLHRNLAVLMEK